MPLAPKQLYFSSSKDRKISFSGSFNIAYRNFKFLQHECKNLTQTCSSSNKTNKKKQTPNQKEKA